MVTKKDNILAVGRPSTYERKARAGFILALGCLAAVGILFYASFQRLRANTDLSRASLSGRLNFGYQGLLIYLQGGF